jgi:hypothetical protein
MRKLFRKLLYVSLLVLINSCTQNYNNQKSAINRDDLSVIRMPGDYKMGSDLNRIFGGVEVLPLETTKDCQLVMPMKVISYDGLYYVLDFQRGLYVFGAGGKYLRQIGNRGKGPGEYLEIRDFDIDKEGNILVLDFKRILKYSSIGTFSGICQQFDFIKNDFYCNPSQFVSLGNLTFYIWGGTTGVKEANSNLFAMYKMRGNNLEKRYFPLKYKLEDKQHRFLRCKNETLINPVLGNDTIFSIKEGNVRAKYYVKFQNSLEPKTIPSNFKTLNDFGMELINNKKISYNIKNPIETDKWLSFAFTYQNNRIITLIDKRSGTISLFKAFRPGEDVIGRLVPYYFDFVDDNSFCSIIPAIDFLKIIKGINPSNSPLTIYSNNIKNIQENDNHVILKYRLK